jgi:bla regulator protein blaR1
MTNSPGKCGRFAVVLVVALVGLRGTRTRGQSQTPPAPAFEVASIKANRTGELGQRIQPSPGGRLTVTNVSLRGLVRFAYELQDVQIDGGPGWFATDRFDVVAKAEGDPPASEIRLMLRTLLAERFNLRTHAEQREQAVYMLVMARSDRKLGPGLRVASSDCIQTAAVGAPFDPNSPCWPPGAFGPAPGVPITTGRLAFRGLTLDGFARSLTGIVRRVVINRTGLAGAYDAEFDASAELPPPPPPPGSGIPNPFDPRNMPSIFSILPEQLGLKLESTRATVEVLMIDRAEKPVEQP